MRKLRNDDGALGQVVAFVTAGAIFLASVGAILLASQGAVTDHTEQDEATKGLEAQGLAALIAGSSGVGWSAGPDHLTRLGLLAANGTSLDPAALEAMRGGVERSTVNGKVDYEDALRSLGVDPASSAGFHLRIYPVGLDDLAVSPDLSVAYIGDWTTLLGVTVALPVSTPAAMAIKANAALNASMFPSTQYERQAIRALGVDFTDQVYVKLTTSGLASYPSVKVDNPSPIPDVELLPLLHLTLMDGDVYPDIKAYLEAYLPARLSQYDVIVVGSGVDHGNLVKQEIKDGIKDWVLAGGTLIVLGSVDQSTAWLSPLFNVGVDTVNGSPTAPDVAHPLLKEPNDLSWTSYDSHGTGWDISESGAIGAYEDFSHVIIQDGEDVLAVSKQASFGSGRVILTSYHARDIAGSMGLGEATAFLENMITYADRSALYLDYGGEVPVDQPVALAVRQGSLWDEVYGQVAVRIEVLAWG
jgi:hypothetical protein